MDWPKGVRRHYEIYDDGRSTVELWTVYDVGYGLTFELTKFDALNAEEEVKPSDVRKMFHEPMGQICWHYFCHEDQIAHRCDLSPTGFCHGDGSFGGATMLLELAHGYRRDPLEVRNDRMFRHLLYRFEESRYDCDPQG